MWPFKDPIKTQEPIYNCPKHGVINQSVGLLHTTRSDHRFCILCFGEWLSETFPVEKAEVADPAPAN